MLALLKQALVVLLLVLVLRHPVLLLQLLGTLLGQLFALVQIALVGHRLLALLGDEALLLLFRQTQLLIAGNCFALLLVAQAELVVAIASERNPVEELVRCVRQTDVSSGAWHGLVLVRIQGAAHPLLVRLLLKRGALLHALRSALLVTDLRSLYLFCVLLGGVSLSCAHVTGMFGLLVALLGLLQFNLATLRSLLFGDARSQCGLLLGLLAGTLLSLQFNLATLHSLLFGDA